MRPADELVRIFAQKAKKVFTYEFWRKRFTLGFWKKRFTLKFWVNRFRFWGDELAGLDFLEVVEPEELGLDPNKAVESAPSGNKYLRNVLKNIFISPNDSIIDLGSGKGSAMRIMLGFPFFRVAGVEISPQIVEIAQKNFGKLNIPIDRYKIFLMDASRFREFDSYNHFYFYNPFSSDIMETVIGNIITSVKQKPRKVLIIYTNPKYEFVILSTGTFYKVCDYPGEWGHRISLYSNMNGNQVVS